MKRYTKAMAMGMAFAMMGSTVAFAEAKETPNDTLLIAQETSPQKQVAFLEEEGKVESVTASEDGSYEVVISNERGGLRFMISGKTVVVNREDGKYMTADKLTEGMQISVLYGANSPMGMSMPPFLGQVTAVVANADKGQFIFGAFDEDLLSKKDMVILNISEDTVIQSTLGTKKVMTADDIKGKEALVFFDITTRSIPAQTNPSFVLILEEEAAAEEVTEEKEEVKEEIKTKTAEELVALRDTAEEKGYTVTWQGKNKPVLVEKDEQAIEITIGATKYVVDDKELEADKAATMVDGVLYVSANILG
ncbi:copper amine oxidase N-terminal domain-containing protein [Anaerotignum sp.]|uniref:copper amine oxidase N-terminal domain-containing protein n=1 Tax=Anaerotignum sp. TaxID=2039241 RepID=UPI0028AC453A|nr:copper amine oxidase N-terminal domain-containing protein [Anaerotignum sp.]